MKLQDMWSFHQGLVLHHISAGTELLLLGLQRPLILYRAEEGVCFSTNTCYDRCCSRQRAPERSMWIISSILSRSIPRSSCSPHPCTPQEGKWQGRADVSSSAVTPQVLNLQRRKLRKLNLEGVEMRRKPKKKDWGQF